jgi:hypothetical protein
MKLRSIAITVAVLAALSLLVFLRNRPQASAGTDPRVGSLLLDADTASRVAGIVITDQGKRVELLRGADGAWIVPSYFGLPADFDKVSRLVQDLNGSKVERLVTENPDRMARLEFKDSAIALRDASGKDIWTVAFGKTPDSGNGRFIRFGSEPKAYFSGTRVWLDTDAKGWADSLLATAKPDDVARIEFALADGSKVAAERKAKDAPWTSPDTPAGKALASDRVASALTALTSLHFSETVDPKDPGVGEAAKFVRTYVLTTFSGRTISISMGRKPEVKKLKPPVADAKAALSSITDAAKKPDEKPVEPEFDTVPAGPVFIGIASSDAAAPVNALMKLRAFQTDEYTFTGLPQKTDDLFEAARAK